MNRTEHNATASHLHSVCFAGLRAIRRGPGRGAPSTRALHLLALLSLTLGVYLAIATPALASATRFGRNESNRTECATSGEAGCLYGTSGLAVDPSSGDVYIPEYFDSRVDQFSPTGEFLLAFGWKVNAATPEEKLQTCTETTGCRAALGGSGAGQLRSPTAGIATDSFGDVYVAGQVNHRIDKFALNSATGEAEFLITFGSEVNKTAIEEGRASEENVCPGAGHPADVCQAGNAGSGPGQLGDLLYGASADIAFDPYGDLWVGGKERLQRFSPTGEFLSEVVLTGAGNIKSLAIDTDPTSPSFGDVYTLKPGVRGTNEQQFVTPPESGPFTLRFEGQTTSTITLQNNQSQQEEAAEVQGALEALPAIGEGNVAVERLGCGGGFCVIFRGSLSATNVPQLEGSAGVTVTTGVQGVPGTPGLLTKRKPSGEAIETLDAAPPFGNPTALAFDPASGDLFVYDQYEPPSNPNASLLRYSPAGALTQAFEPEIGGQSVSVMAFSTHTARLYLTAGSYGWIVPPPPLGPLIKRGLSVTPERHGAAAFRAKVSPQGKATEVKVEYVDQADFETGGFAGAASSASVSLAATDFAYHPVEVKLPQGTLVPGATYHWRLKATNSDGEPTEEGPEFDETPIVLLDGPFATDVTSNTATLEARVNPLGTSTTYTLQYGTTTAYGHEFTGQVGEGTAFVPIAHLLTGLAPSTTYHYRLTATNLEGQVESSDRTFTTQPAVAGPVLPDGRAWEQVTPPDKRGANITFQASAEGLQAAAGGSGIAYYATDPLTDAARTGGEARVLSTRTATGWRAQEMMPSKGLPEDEVEAGRLGAHTETAPPLFSRDLSDALIEPTAMVKPLSPEATERTLYIWDAATETYLPLVTPANVPLGTHFGGGILSPLWMEFLNATPDFRHLVFTSPYPLTPEAPTSSELATCEHGSLCEPGMGNLYEWSGGQLRLINVLPSGEPTLNAFLGHLSSLDVAHAISADGRWIVWTYAPPSESPTLYVRDTQGERTYQVGRPGALFETMSADGSRVFYLEKEALHLFDTATQTDTEITPPPAGEPTAGVQDTLLGASEDGSRVYVVADGVLTGTQRNASGEAAVSGKPNLYLLQETGSGWTPTFIATLASQDERTWSAIDPISHMQQLDKVTSHVSPDGRWLAFMSERPLTGYDNHDAISGEADEEVFLYDASSGRLLCASCNPTGARPRGIFDENGANFQFDRASAWLGHWLAASMPGWRSLQGGRVGAYQPRNLLDSGRLFFQSPDALVPQDTNGKEDVYEYEPAGAGSCTEESPTYSPASAGCVNLISSGTSPQESVFYDASESGNDVFFTTTSRLVSSDVDKAADLYDAHVCTEASPCPPPPPPPPPVCEGDACQPPVAAPNDETLSSSSYHGPGNERPSRKPRKHKGHRKHHKRAHRGQHHRRARSNRGGHK